MSIEKIRNLSNVSHKEWEKVVSQYCREESKGFDQEAGIKNLTDINRLCLR